MEKCKDKSTNISKGIGTEYPCENYAWKDGYCKIHHPEQKAKAQKTRWATWEKKWAIERSGKAQLVAGDDYKDARKEAGLLTFEEARKLGAKI